MANEKNLKPFKPGNDERRNLKGAPKKLPQIDALLADVLGSADDENSEAKAVLNSLLKQAKSGNVRAIEVLLDRAYGKAKQTIDIDAVIDTTVKVGYGENKGD